MAGMTATDQLATGDLQELAHRHLLMHFTRNGAYGPEGKPLLVLERGEGSYVFDTDGKRYFDGLSSLFCAQIGYSFGEEMASVAGRQLSTMAFNTNWATAHPPAIHLAEAIAERAPGDLNRVFFTNGGSESVEAAWKLVRQYYVARGEEQRTKAIARDIAYHGVTLGALSFTGVKSMKEPFGRAPIDVVRVSNTNDFRGQRPDLVKEMEDTILREGPETIAMIIAEPVQNAGGCLVPPEGYWAGLRELADRYGIALVADEVITGFGRIGEWFAAPKYGATPDLITCAKGITSAYAPMGAVIVSDKIAAPLYEDKRMLLHGITYGGHPVAAAMALRNIEIFEREGVLENVRELEPYIEQRLGELQERIPIVGDVRGAGFFWALELVRDEDGTPFDADEREALLRGFMTGRLLEEGLIARPDDRGDSVLHLAPPLVATRDELDEMVAKTEAVLVDASERFFGGA
jgi:adenosylmethionine-8-amino-7-oxononanoate aminotransferase